MRKAGYLLLPMLSILLCCILPGCQSQSTPQAGTGISTIELTVELLGKKHTVLLDSQGKATASAEMASPDGAVTLSINKGARLISNDSKQLTSIRAEIEQKVLPLVNNAQIVSIVYNMGPPDAVFSPYIRLSLVYIPRELPFGVNESDVYIVPYDEGIGWGQYQYKTVDTERNRVTTQIERLTRYAVLAPVKPPLSESTPKVSSASGLTSIPLPQALASGKPTIAEFGRGTCIPCKAMKPILEELAVEYRDRLNVAIVSVDEYRDLTSRYKIMAIPTQIFYDAGGQEVMRHVGFWAKAEIITQLRKMGIQ